MMRKLILIFFSFLLFQACIGNKNVIDLPPSRSMLITGKGPGQDGAINPFIGTKNKAIIKNMEKSSFEIRVQKEGKIIETIEIGGREKKEVVLLEGYELYFDGDLAAKARVRFVKLD